MEQQQRTDWQAPRDDLGGQSLEDWLREHYASRPTPDLLIELQERGVEITYKAMRRKAESMGLTKRPGDTPQPQSPAAEPHIVPNFGTNAPKLGTFDWRATIDAAISLQGQRAVLEFVQNCPEPIVIETDSPIALSFSADWHLGSGTTDHVTWRRDVDYLLMTPGLYYAILGDEMENIRAFRTLQAVIAQVLPVDLQREVLQAVVLELVAQGKLLFTVWGNHGEGFDERLLGESLLNELRRKQGVPHVGGIGLVRLTVGRQTYTILVTHKAKYRSSFNALHAAKRLYQMVFPADLVVTAHDHLPGHEEYNHYELGRETGLGFGGTSWLVACATYKTEATNDWAARNYGRAVLKRETAVLWPDEHRIEMFDNAQAAVQRIQAA